MCSSDLPFDAAIVDLHLPDCAEDEIVDLMAAHGIPTIVFTGSFDPALRQRILDKNVFDYVLKDTPDAIDAVVRSVDRVCRNGDVAVLVVDDSRTARHHLAAFLRTLRFQVFEADSGAAALQCLTEHPDIKVIIADYNMPSMDGSELVSWIRREHRHDRLAIIGISDTEGSDRHALSTRFLKRGANDFVTKPFSREELTHKVHLHVEMLEQFAELREQSDRLRSLNQQKNRFLSIAAHDLRNPLSSVRGFSELLLGGGVAPINPDQEQLLALIHGLSNQMLELVNDLLDISVIESGQVTVTPAPGSLGHVLEERIRITELAAARKQITIEASAQPVPQFPFDANRIAQVIDNLLTNAVKFSPPGSAVQARLDTDTTSREARVSVTDHGPGLTPEDQTRLFGEFQKLSAQPTAGEKSTGLGLSIAKKIVEAHH